MYGHPNAPRTLKQQVSGEAEGSSRPEKDGLPGWASAALTAYGRVRCAYAPKPGASPSSSAPILSGIPGLEPRGIVWSLLSVVAAPSTRSTQRAPPMGPRRPWSWNDPNHSSMVNSTSSSDRHGPWPMSRSARRTYITHVLSQHKYPCAPTPLDIP